MSSTEEIYDDGVDEVIHSDYFFVEFGLRFFQKLVVEMYITESLFEVACIYQRFFFYQLFFVFPKFLQEILDGSLVFQYEKIEENGKDCQDYDYQNNNTGHKKMHGKN